MINLKKLLKGEKNIVALNKEEVEVLTYVLCHRDDFQNWFQQQQHKYQKIRFQFYYPSALDLYYDTFKLFTAYFKKDAADHITFSEMKMSRLNLGSLHSSNWAPFKDVIVDYLSMAQERNTDLQFRQFRSLHDYQQLCNGGAPAPEAGSAFTGFNITPAHLNS